MMETPRRSSFPQGGWQKLSPSMSLTRQISGISHSMHEGVMYIASMRMSDRSASTPIPRTPFRHDLGSIPHPHGRHATLMASSSSASPEDRNPVSATPMKGGVYYSNQMDYERKSPGEQSCNDSGRNSTKTPTSRNFNNSLLRLAMSSSSCLRFNASSLVSLPYLFCNNTFVKMNIDEALDHSIVKQRASQGHQARGSSLAANGVKRRGTLRGNQASSHNADDQSKADIIESIRTAIYSKYSTNPYSRTYAKTTRDRRGATQVERNAGNRTPEVVLSPSSSEGLMSISESETDSQDEEEYETEDSIEVYSDDSELSLLDLPDVGKIAPIFSRLQRLSETELFLITPLMDERLELEKEMLHQTLDVVEAAILFKKLVRGALVSNNVKSKLIELFKDLGKISDLSRFLKTFLKDMENSIIILQYAKRLLRGSIGLPRTDRDYQTNAAVTDATPDFSTLEDIPSNKERHMSQQTSPSCMLRDEYCATTASDVVASSPCTSFAAGARCLRGQCSTSPDSFNASRMTECYAAAGCYLWDNRLLSLKHAGEDELPKREAAKIITVNLTNEQSNPTPEVPEYEHYYDDEGEVHLLGKTGPWTCDYNFNRKIQEQNRRRHFNTVKEFLKDVCQVAMAEVLIPKPAWSGNSEQKCLHESCCTRCCTCRDGTTLQEMLLRTCRDSIHKENPDIRFEIETVMATINMHKASLGRCFCACECNSVQPAMEEVVRQHTRKQVTNNFGILWHDMEPLDQVLDASSPVLINEGVFQERITLRIKADRLPQEWKQEAPFVCKLDLSFKEEEPEEDDSILSTDASGLDEAADESGASQHSGLPTPSDVSIIDYSNLEDGYTTDGSDMDVDDSFLYVPPPVSESKEIKRDKNAKNFVFSPFKNIRDFTMWDALDLLRNEQTCLHHLDEDRFEYFDPLEIDNRKLTVRKLELDLDSLVTEPSNEAYVDISLYLPYVPSCIFPWRFESLVIGDIIEKHELSLPKVEVEHIRDAVILTRPDGSPLETDIVEDEMEETEEEDDDDDDDLDSEEEEDTEEDDIDDDEIEDERIDDTEESSSLASMSTNDEEGSMDDESSETTYSDDDSTDEESKDDFDGSDSDTSMSNYSCTSVNTDSDVSSSENTLNIEALERKVREMLRECLFREVIIVSQDVWDGFAFMREHVMMRNHCLKMEAEACKQYKQHWHRYLALLRETSPKVDLFSWGILPIRAMDFPDMFIPLPAGYKQNDINWPYTLNKTLSPFEVKGHGIWDLDYTTQRFSVIGQKSEEEADTDNTMNEQVHSFRKTMFQRRRAPVESDPSDSTDDETSRATVWLAPSYSNLTGPGIRWTLSCMDNLSDPMLSIPEYSILPIYKVMCCADMGLYKLDKCVQYDRVNALEPDDVIEQEKIRSLSSLWTKNECRIFIEKYFMYPKNFAKIAQFVETKKCSECINFYYRFKYRLQLKKRLMDLKEKSRSKHEMTRFMRKDYHVIQALDCLFDDCHTEHVEAICVQNCMSLNSVSEYLLHPGGITTGRSYEVAFTQHRGNWSPFEAKEQVPLDNLNEGYFLPTKYRCLVTRKNMELPLSMSDDRNELALKRGCLLFNGRCENDETDMFTSLISAIKMDHYLSLKPLCSRRVAGRSILEALYADTVEKAHARRQLESRRHQKEVATENHDDRVRQEDSNQECDDDSNREYDDDNNHEYDGDKTPEYGDDGNLAYDDDNPAYGDDGDLAYDDDKTPEYEDDDMQYDNTDSDERELHITDEEAQYMPYDNGKYRSQTQYEPISGHPSQGDHDSYSSDNISTGEYIGGSRSSGTSSYDIERQYHLGNIKCSLKEPYLGANSFDGVQRTAAYGLRHMEHVRDNKGHLNNRPVYVNENGRNKRNRTMVEWTQEEVEKLYRLMSIYNDDWDIIASLMASYGKTKEDIIGYYEHLEAIVNAKQAPRLSYAEASEQNSMHNETQNSVEYTEEDDASMLTEDDMNISQLSESDEYL